MRTMAVLGALLSISGGAIAQSEALKFEVASIKPSAPDARGMFIRPGPGGGVTITNMTLKELIVLAWRVQPFQISGGPAWIDSLHYDIVAKPENRPGQGEIPRMMQALLQDRFQLAIHRDSKELPIYALVLARKDGKLGPNLVESKEGSCAAIDLAKPPPPPEPGKAPGRFCGQLFMSLRGVTAIGHPIADLTPMLARILGRSVMDETGLTGKFDITAEWAPDQSISFPGGAPPPPQSSDATGPNIFTAFQEQLGLKLESQKGPVEMIIIDRAEKPSEN